MSRLNGVKPVSRALVAAALLLALPAGPVVAQRRPDPAAPVPAKQDAAKQDSAGVAGLGVGALVCIGVVGMFFYLVPTFVAFSRGHQNTAAIAALNLLLGWSFLGWAVAIVWSFTEVKTRRRHYNPADYD